MHTTLTPHDLSDALGVKPQTVQRWIREKKTPIPVHWVGDSPVFVMSDLIAHISPGAPSLRPKVRNSESYDDYRLGLSLRDQAAFWNRVKKGEANECWPWEGAKSGQYGSARYRDKTIPAHRLAWMIEHGVNIGNPLLVVCHHCDNPPCCNPRHLFIGSSLDNMRDRDAKGRGKHRT